MGSEKTEPMYLISESKLHRLAYFAHLLDEEKEIRAPGPVAQQAPDIDTLNFAMGLAECLGTGHAGDFEECLLCPLEKKCKTLSDFQDPEHDAALIAQEREKWERERDQKYVLTLSALREISADVELKDYRKSCIHDPVCQWLCTAGNCPFHVTLDRHNATIAAQAREDVLKEVEEYWSVGDCCYPTDHPHHQNSPLCHKTPHCIICFMRKNISESLRHGQEQGRDPK